MAHRQSQIASDTPLQVCVDRDLSMAAAIGEELTMHGCIICGTNICQNFLRSPDRFHGRSIGYQLVRCSSCSLVWLEAPPAPSEMWQHYGKAYDRAISRAGKDARFWAGRRATVLKHKSGGTVLDLGCSSGGFLASLAGPSWNRFGIEMSENVARVAESSGAQVFVGDILDAPFQPESFDVITCFHVFEHLHQPRQVLAKVHQWLKPGGIFYAEMPNIDSLDAFIFRSYWHSLELPRHLYHFSPLSVRRLLLAAGFSEIQIETTPATYAEHSIRYLVDHLYSRIGLSRPPAAVDKSSTLPWRVVRKLNRLTIFALLGRFAAACGRGPDLRAVFQKQQP